jgi:hypothetical protein
VSIKEAAKLGYTILVGTHKAGDMIQKEINHILKKESYYGPDGNLYRPN